MGIQTGNFPASPGQRLSLGSSAALSPGYFPCPRGLTTAGASKNIFSQTRGFACGCRRGPCLCCPFVSEKGTAWSEQKIRQAPASPFPPYQREPTSFNRSGPLGSLSFLPPFFPFPPQKRPPSGRKAASPPVPKPFATPPKSFSHLSESKPDRRQSPVGFPERPPWGRSWTRRQEVVLILRFSVKFPSGFRFLTSKKRPASK